MADEKEQSRKVLEETYAELSEEDRAFLKARIGIEDEAKLKEHILQVQVDAWTVSARARYLKYNTDVCAHDVSGPQVSVHPKVCLSGV